MAWSREREGTMRTRREAWFGVHGSEICGEVSWSPAGLDVGRNVQYRAYMECVVCT